MSVTDGAPHLSMNSFLIETYYMLPYSFPSFLPSQLMAIFAARLSGILWLFTIASMAKN
jgi:hypothetical protein